MASLPAFTFTFLRCWTRVAITHGAPVSSEVLETSRLVSGATDNFRLCYVMSGFDFYGHLVGYRTEVIFGVCRQIGEHLQTARVSDWLCQFAGYHSSITCCVMSSFERTNASLIASLQTADNTKWQQTPRLIDC